MVARACARRGRAIGGALAAQRPGPCVETDLAEIEAFSRSKAGDRDPALAH